MISYSLFSGLVALAAIALVKVLDNRLTDKEMDSIMAKSSQPIDLSNATDMTDNEGGPILPIRKTNAAATTSFSRRGTLIETLRNMGCQPEQDEDYVYINYHDDNFVIATSEDSYFIQIFNTNWCYVSLDDIDSVTRVRTAINKLNVDNSFNIVYTLDEQKWLMNVHTRYTTVWTPGITRREEYLNLLFCGMINAHQLLGNMLEELMQTETKNA